MSKRLSIWQRLALTSALIFPALVPLIRLSRSDLAEMWATHRLVIEQMVLAFAFVCLTAAIVSGVVTWQRETRLRRDAQ